MPQDDEIDAGEVLKKLAELKRTLPEDQYQEIERQVLPHLAEHFGGIKRAEKESQVLAVLEALLWIGGLVLFFALAQRFEWLGWVYVGAIVLRGLLVFFAWLSEAMKPPRMY